MRKSLKGLGGFPTLTSGFILGPSGRRCGSAFSTQVSGLRCQVSGSPFNLRLETVNQAIQASSDFSHHFVQAIKRGCVDVVEFTRDRQLRLKFQERSSGSIEELD